MLLGTFEGRVDAQGRVVIPQRFREPLEGGIVLARGIDGCIDVYPPREWDEVASTVKSFSRFNRNARLARRLTFSGAYKASMDRQGRVVVPPALRQHAAIAEEVVIIGQDTYLEVWSRDRWREQEAQEANLAEIAEGLEAANG
ncbi:MAG: division/cell wall cluster transcriptional repressor MraZ [Chloroflexi bacterium]|nr:division/cell wall cluster transcriptional repressor MraZ [Chloroflexota bacterium]